MRLQIHAVARRLAAVALVLVLALAGPLAPPLAAQQTAPAGAPSEAVDFGAWNTLAGLAEDMLAAGDTSTDALTAIRAELADWRTRLLAAQSVNAERIQTVRDQIAALGPPPAEGETEAEDIATRRAELGAQLAELQAPRLEAAEAHTRADGLVRQIDATLRARQADALRQSAPAPVNPANWPVALSEVSATATRLVGETAANLSDPLARAQLRTNLLWVLGYLVVAVVALAFGRRRLEQLVGRLLGRGAARGRFALAFVVSLAQIVLPVVGLIALVRALLATGLLGPIGAAMVAELQVAGTSLIVARWLATQMFPHGAASENTLFRLAPEAQAEGRFHVTCFGLILALGVLVPAAFPGDALAAVVTRSLLNFPLLLVAGVLLFRIGQLLRRHVVACGDEAGYVDHALGVVGRVAMAAGVAGPAMAAVGYVPAAEALLYPAGLSVGLIGLLLLLQRFANDLIAIVLRQSAEAETGLLSVLVGLVLVLASVPVFALIWGARWIDILEVGAQLQAGFDIGGTRIAPANFLWFVFLFVIGYTATRAVQGALRTSILPKTRMDTGARNAIVSGTGYVGIFLAAVIAITGAGIDLSSLAIVAGALSVGIGFGLQNIVSNFVSGIILLIERPVTEGDWIEVGGQMGVVKAISVRSTRIETFDRTDVIVPNADLVSGTVTNWTRSNLNSRLIFKVGVAYGSDTRRVEAILREIIEAQPLVMLAPPPSVLFMGFGADSLDFEIRAIISDVNFGLTVRSDVNHEIAERFAREGIEIPFAQRDIWLRNPEALRASSGGDAPAAPAAPARPPDDPAIGLHDSDRGDDDAGEDGGGDGR